MLFKPTYAEIDNGIISGCEVIGTRPGAVLRVTIILDHNRSSYEFPYDDELGAAHHYLMKDSNRGRGGYDRQLLRIAALRELMRDGVAHFSYYKLGGSYRRAFGTRNKEILHRYKPTGMEAVPAYDEHFKKVRFEAGYFVYYDIEKRGWRQFRFDTDLSFSDFYEL